MTFRNWLETQLADFHRLQDVVLSFLDLDPQDGLSQPLAVMNRDQLKAKLNGLGEFAKLPPQIQSSVMSSVEAGRGTIGDLVRTMSKGV